MKKLLLLSLLVLAGCATSVPVAVKFPEVPGELMKSCPDLKTVDANTTKLSEVLATVVDNYGTYYNCKSNVDDWIEWYNTQQKIFNNIK
jgi:hypothetical protein